MIKNICCHALAPLSVGAIALLLCSGSVEAQEKDLSNDFSPQAPSVSTPPIVPSHTNETMEAPLPIAQTSDRPQSNSPNPDSPSPDINPGSLNPNSSSPDSLNPGNTNDLNPNSSHNNNDNTTVNSTDDRNTNAWIVQPTLQFGINAVAESNLFWNFADVVAPTANFDSDTEWLELYIEPGVNVERRFDESVLYGRLSGVASYTLGSDAYGARDTGRVTLEEAYLGYRTMFDDGLNFDVSIGPRELRLGTGMLVANGGSNGFERGALKLGPRKAWGLAAIGRLIAGDVTGTLFYLDANELSSSDNENAIAGLDLRYDHASGNYVGLTYVNVVNSETPYPQAAPSGIGVPTVIPGARDGLNALNLYARANPFGDDLEQFFVTGEVAYQWNDRINLQAWGGRIQAGYTFDRAPWSPSLILYYQSFSGDNPDTSNLERFDPLSYEGSPSAWATGSKSSMVFINSNVQAIGLSLRLSPSRRSTLTFRYAHILANELGSPIQFGQATRLEFESGVSNVISGVTNRHLSDDFFLEYSHILSPNIFLTAGFSVSLPGRGITSAFEGDTPVWTGGFVNVVFNF